MKTFRFISFVLIGLFFIRCNDKQSDKPFIVVLPDNSNIQAYTDDKIVFSVKVLSDFRLTNFTITKQYKGESELIILDSVINAMNLNFQWSFHIPDDVEEDFYLRFKVTNENGYQSVATKILIFNGKKFEETTGLKMYSANSGLPSAFNLVTLQLLPISTDSTGRDIQEFQADTSFTNLSYKWISPSGCRFVKLNGFDYSNASGSSAKAGYEVGIPLSEVANIVIGDIYIIKIVRLQSESSYAVIKINNIIDSEGRNNDFYEFSVKK